MQFSVLLDRLSLFFTQLKLPAAKMRAINQKPFKKELPKADNIANEAPPAHFSPDLHINIVMTFDKLPFL